MIFGYMSWLLCDDHAGTIVACAAIGAAGYLLRSEGADHASLEQRLIMT